MADTETETAPAGPQGESRLDKLESKVDGLISKIEQVLKGGGGEQGSETEPDQPASMAAEVRREVERLRAEEQRVQHEEQRDKDVADLKEKVNAERPPREYRRATKMMRWDTEADR